MHYKGPVVNPSDVEIVVPGFGGPTSGQEAQPGGLVACRNSDCRRSGARPRAGPSSPRSRRAMTCRSRRASVRRLHRPSRPRKGRSLPAAQLRRARFSGAGAAPAPLRLRKDGPFAAAGDEQQLRRRGSHRPPDNKKTPEPRSGFFRFSPEASDQSLLARCCTIMNVS